MRIQSDIKIKNAIRLIDERIHLLTKIKREWNDQQKDKLELYCIALTGNQIELSSRNEIDSKNIGWAISEFATTEGETIYLPSQSNKYSSKAENNSILWCALYG